MTGLVAAGLLGCVTLLIVSAAESADWHLISIPDTWKNPPAGKLASRDGYSWYRCLVKVPTTWKDKNVDLFVEPVDDARAIYFNGTQVGAAGTFPPRYRSGLGEPARHRLPQKDIRFGGWNVVAVRVYYYDGRSNFSVAAPVLLCDKEAIRLEGKWQARPGDNADWSKPVETPESVAGATYETVDKVDDVERYVRRRKGDHDPYTPAEAVKLFKIPADLSIETALAEPDVRQPLSINFDERGRMWVMQYLQYPDPAGLKMVSRDQHLRTVWDKVPPPPPHNRPETKAYRGADKITIHEMDDQGKYTKHKTFIDGLSIATSCARGRGGVFVLNPPYLLFYADKNNDDIPDGDPEVLLEGFGLEDTHSVANSLRWGPDGWLYAAQGSTVTGQVKRPGDKEAVHSMGQLIWRYHPETKRYEIFAEGGGNAFGVEMDAKGRIYSGYNGGDTRGFHYVQGGYYQKGFTKHGSLSNPYAFGFFPAMTHHSVPRFTHTFLLYEDDALPMAYRNRLFGVEPLQGQVVMSEVMPDRSSFKTKDLSRPITTTDQWFRPVDIKTGPDGAIYVVDLYEQRIDHSSHYAGRVDRSNGRIYRLMTKGAPVPEHFDYSKFSGHQLLDLLTHHNRWQRETALRLIGDRKDRTLIAPLKELLEQKTTYPYSLEALWALNLCGGLSEEVALKTLQHKDPFVRLWTARLLCDEKSVAPAIARKLVEQARAEDSVHARSQLACSARRLTAKDGLPIVKELLAHDEDAGDIHIPLLLWWAIESKCATDAETVLALVADKGMWERPMVRQVIVERLMRRFAQAGSRKDLLVCARLLELAPGQDHVKRLMTGFEQAYQGRSLAGLPDELVKVMARVGGGSPALRVRQGDEKATAEALKVIADDKADRKQRLQYVQIFGEVRHPGSVPVLLALVEKSRDDTLRKSALTALQIHQDAKIGSEIVGLYAKLPEDVRSVAQTLLASRKPWALELLKAVDAGKIDRALVPAEALRKVLLHDDKQLTALVKKHWGDIEGATTEEMRKRIEQLTKVIRGGSGNPYPGRKLYSMNCGKCHTLFGDGGQVGPDLTPYQRGDLDRLLVNVVNPSAEIREGFEAYIVQTKSGRVVTGFLADQDNRVVVVRGVDGQSLVVPRDEIEEMRKSDRSVMPEDTLKGLTDQQLRDLFAYLRSSQPLP
jgi:putative membrane-bound dehydrogenase-like protein